MSEITPAEAAALSPEQATAKLAELQAQHVASAAPNPNPTNAGEAAARLHQLGADEGWRDQVLKGNVEAKREFDALTALVASGSEVDQAMAGVVPAGHIHVGAGASLPEMAAGAATLRAAGISEDAIREVLTDRKTNPIEYAAVKQHQAALLGNKEWVARLLGGDYAARRELLLTNIVLSEEIDNG